MTNLYISITCILLICGSCNGKAETRSKHTKPQVAGRVGGPCETCELINVDKPKHINSTDTSAAWQSGAQKLVVKGTVYKPDRKTPAGGVLIYYWQTNEKGVYENKNTLTSVKKHGYIRGWVKTDQQGQYKIYTIRPAPYPTSKEPAHIHLLVKEPDLPNEYYVDNILFENDPLLTNAIISRLDLKGGNGVVKVLEKDGSQTVTRDIILGLNITNYPRK